METVVHYNRVRIVNYRTFRRKKNYIVSMERGESARKTCKISSRERKINLFPYICKEHIE